MEKPDLYYEVGGLLKAIVDDYLYQVSKIDLTSENYDSRAAGFVLMYLAFWITVPTVLVLVGLELSEEVISIEAAQVILEMAFRLTIIITGFCVTNVMLESFNPKQDLETLREDLHKDNIDPAKLAEIKERLGSEGESESGMSVETFQHAPVEYFEAES